MNEDEIAFKGELWLLSWKESHNNGATVTFQLADADELQPFKAMTVKKGRRAGQRMMCVLVEVGDDEQPVRQEKKGGPLSKSAAQMCEHPPFRTFLSINYAADWFRSWNLSSRACDEDVAAADVVRDVCGIKSRAELDHNEQAARRFRELMREFREWNEGKGAP